MPQASTATLRGPGPVTVRVLIGDGLMADWTIKVRRDGAVVHQAHGKTSDGDPTPVHVAAPQGCTVEWAVILFGAASPRAYRVKLQVQQDGRSLLDVPITRPGQAPARRTAVESGQVRFVAAA